jgi:hypothetical protein
VLYEGGLDRWGRPTLYGTITVCGLLASVQGILDGQNAIFRVIFPPDDAGDMQVVGTAVPGAVRGPIQGPGVTERMLFEASNPLARHGKQPQAVEFALER